MNDIQRAVSMAHANGHNTDIAEDNTQQPLRTAMDAVDETDLTHQSQVYTNILLTEYINTSDRLRHRADMMRRRADEFDAIADSMDKAANDLNHRVHEAAKGYEAALQLISDHAHIRPSTTR